METTLVLREIYTLWFDNPEWWFNAPPEVDRLLEDKFTTWIEATQSYISFDRQPQIESISKEDYVALIILFDQIPRHAYRISCGAHCVQYYLQYATYYAEYFSHTDCTLYNALNAYEWSFVKLPWRHTDNVWMIRTVMSDTWQKLAHIEKESAERAHLRRFLRATYERYPFQVYNEHDYIAYWMHEKSQFIISESGYSIYKDLLAYCPKVLASTELTEATEPNNAMKKTSLWQTISESICIHHKQNYIISLSGGVDSIVCSYIIALKLRERMKHIKLCAVHINYSNRPECAKEEEFLRDWCHLIDIPLYIRRIDEIHRKECMDEDLRETYETYTRNIRYSTYKHVWNKCFSIGLEDGDDQNTIPGIILGHNKDDCFENIMTNITHCSKYDNLEGMSAEGIQDGICFIRPFLTIPKADIYQFSRDYNIPHLQTSTPSWSMRGQIRDSVKPAIIKWNPQCIDGLHELSTRMGELYDILNIYVDNHLVKLRAQNGTIEFQTMSEISESQVYWKMLISKYTNYHTIPSVKSIKQLIDHISRFKLNNKNNKNNKNNNKNNKTCDNISVKISPTCQIQMLPVDTVDTIDNVKIILRIK
jgi:tRNA(Ile)-lysidine synthetase-like protein